MKNKLQLALIACAALAATNTAHAAPRCADRQQTAQVRSLCQNKTTRILMIRELMNTKEGRQEMAEMLGHDNGEFRSYYETHAGNPG